MLFKAAAVYSFNFKWLPINTINDDEIFSFQNDEYVDP